MTRFLLTLLLTACGTTVTVPVAYDERVPTPQECRDAGVNVRDDEAPIGHIRAIYVGVQAQAVCYKTVACALPELKIDSKAQVRYQFTLWMVSEVYMTHEKCHALYVKGDEYHTELHKRTGRLSP